MNIVRATTAHVPALAALMAASPLLRRYAVTERGARARLAEARRARDVLMVALDPGVVGFAWVILTRALDQSAYLRLLLVAEGRQYLEFATHLALFPGLAIMIAVLGFNLLGDGLRDALDPQRR